MMVAFVIWTQRLLVITTISVIVLSVLLLSWLEFQKAKARSLVNSSDIMQDSISMALDPSDHGVINVLNIYSALNEKTSAKLTNSIANRLVFHDCELRLDPAVRGLATLIVRETSKDRTIKNAIRREYVACELGRRFGQKSLRLVWLQKVYFGQGIYGLEAAAREYFDLSTQQISHHQAAMLVALIYAPNLSSKDSEVLVERANAILERIKD